MLGPVLKQNPRTAPQDGYAVAPKGPSRRVMLFAEGVTLAHVARPLAIASALVQRGHHVTLAVDDRYARLTFNAPFRVVTAPGIEPARFLAALARGRPVFDVATLRRYVRDDLRLIEQEKPDVVIGDFRLSLAVSARRAGVPYAAISNAYWSPAHRPAQFPLPVLPFTSFVPLGVARLMFRTAQPLAFSLHARPMEQLRREHGLPALGGDLQRAYTDSDRTLYADVPEMYSAEGAAAECFLGAMPWSPSVERPSWWNEWEQFKGDRIYVTLGSSGAAHLTGRLLQALANLPVLVAVSTAGRMLAGPLPANARQAAYLPGSEMSRNSALVVCNGGSPATQQALMEGVPVVGVCSNMDQFMNMQSVERAGAGVVVRADRAGLADVRATLRAALADAGLINRARAWKPVFARHDFAAAVERHVQALTELGAARPTASASGRSADPSAAS